MLGVRILGESSVVLHSLLNLSFYDFAYLFNYFEVGLVIMLFDFFSVALWLFY